MPPEKPFCVEKQSTVLWLHVFKLSQILTSVFVDNFPKYLWAEKITLHITTKARTQPQFLFGKKHVPKIPITFLSYLHITSSHKCLLNKHYRYSNGISNVGNIVNVCDCDICVCVFVLHSLIRLARHDPDLTKQFVFLYANDENCSSFVSKKIALICASICWESAWIIENILLNKIMWW